MNRLVPNSSRCGFLHPARRSAGLFTALILFAWLAGPALVLAGDEALPKGEDILDNYVKATGGKAVYLKLHNRVSKGNIEIPAMGLKMSLTLYEAAPNKNYVVTESGSLGKTVQGTNGEVVWQTSMMMGPQVIEGKKRAAGLREALFQGDVEWRKNYDKAECVGIATVDEKTCYKIVMTPKESDPETRYYDKESGLCIKIESIHPSEMGDIPIETFLSDYKQVGGILFPHKMKQVLLGGVQTMVITFDSIEHNVDIPADRFDLPPEIKALIEKEKADKAKADTPKENEPKTP